jgi:hypothetical protein
VPAAVRKRHDAAAPCESGSGAVWQLTGFPVLTVGASMARVTAVFATAAAEVGKAAEALISMRSVFSGRRR